MKRRAELDYAGVDTVPRGRFEIGALVRYRYVAAVGGDSYFIEMVNIDGGSERYGPYEMGVEYGEPSAVEPTELVNPMYLPIISGR